jgi:hydroxyethylthiazole kinase-like uncharacterized protein yjeF
MHRVLSREQIRAFDRHAIETCKVPGLVLMENAGRGAAEVMLESVASDAGLVVIVCGAGNNGGDGFVVARHLASRGLPVGVWFIGAIEKVRGDARANLDAWRGLGGTVSAVASEADLPGLADALELADVVVDGLFGTGLDREVKGLYAAAIDAINRSPARKVALDLPSGLDSDTGKTLGVVVKADETITFGALKLGLLTPNGAAVCGRIHLATLGVPSSIIDEIGHSAEVITSESVGALLGSRAPGTHKHAEGSVLAFAGDAGKVGASMLVAMGALRVGAGLATVASWPEAVRALDQRVIEVMTAAIDPERIDGSVQEALRGRKAVAIGPGFGLGERARKVIDQVVLGWDGPIVVDADAITAFAGRAAELASAKGKIVLTPHAGEMARLLGTTSREVDNDRFGAVRRAVRETKATVVLKGAHSIVGLPDGRMFVNTSGGPMLATAGSGDVLTGMIAGLCCTMSAGDAAVCGVHLHGLAGEAWAKESKADRGMLAGEIANALPAVIAELTG